MRELRLPWLNSGFLNGRMLSGRAFTANRRRFSSINFLSYLFQRSEGERLQPCSNPTTPASMNSYGIQRKFFLTVGGKSQQSLLVTKVAAGRINNY